MKILVTGHRGQLGREVVRCAVERGHDVSTVEQRWMDDPPSDLRPLIGKPDLAINCAAFNDVDLAEQFTSDAVMVNAVTPSKIAAMVPRFVTFSTDFVFDGRKSLRSDTREGYTTEDTPRPLNAYGLSKLTGEVMVSGVNPESLIVRTSWLFSSHDSRSNFMLWLYDAFKNERTDIRLDKTRRAVPTYAPDLAEATFDMIDQGWTGLVHAVNDGPGATRQDMAQELAELMVGSDVDWCGYGEPMFDPAKAHRPMWSVLESSVEMPDWRDAVKRFIGEVTR